MGRYAGGGEVKRKLRKRKLTEAEAKTMLTVIQAEARAFLAECRESERAWKKWRKELYEVMQEMARELKGKK